MKNLFLFLFCLITINLLGQVTSLDYLMKYNCETNQYDVSIVILEGSATTIPQRAQFYSMVSIVVPTGETVEIVDKYMPLQNNQTYTGTIPARWETGYPLIAPEAQPENDFIGVVPFLSPAAFYNDLEEGNIVKLFSFTVGETGQYDEKVRFFKNGEDPASNEPGMNNGDFANGFTMGGSAQLYNENSVESCVTDIEEELTQIANVYPNPFQNQFTIEVPEDTKNIYVLGTNGKLHYQVSAGNKELISINTINFVSGVYFVRIESHSGKLRNTRIVKL